MNQNRAAYYIMKPEGKKVITPEDITAFVKTYEPIYFLPEMQDEANNVLNFFGVSQSRRWIEEDMEALLGIGELKKATWEKSDVIHILAWKMGRINHLESENRDNYKFTGNDEKKGKISWSDGRRYDFYRANNRSGDIKHVSEFADCVLKLKENYSRKDYINHPKDLLKELRETLQVDTQNKVTGIGSVYLITILYFISGGKYPIYDQFAAMALRAILEGNKPGTSVLVKDLPDKNSNSFLNMLDNPKSAYREYISMLEKVSELYYNGDKDGYQKDRSLDRALWVYGHLFTQQ